MTVLSVFWHDAWFDFDKPESGYRTDYLVNTVGFVVREDESVLSIASEQLPDEEGYRGTTHIPKATIVKRQPLLHGLPERP